MSPPERQSNIRENLNTIPHFLYLTRIVAPGIPLAPALYLLYNGHIPFVNFKPHIYRWVLPLAFGINSIVSFKFPGDEYGLWAMASVPGVWIALLKNGDIKSLCYPVALVGMLVMAFVGWRMSRIPVKASFWLACSFIIPSVIWLSVFIKNPKMQLPDMLFGLIGLGIWLGSLVSILVAYVGKHWSRNSCPS